MHAFAARGDMLEQGFAGGGSISGGDALDDLPVLACRNVHRSAARKRLVPE